MNQGQKIINYMEKNGVISSLAAMRYIGTVSLHRRLSDLRELGYVFKDGWYGTGCKQYKVYWIVKRPKGVRL